jgi:predicted metal-dependent phosphoesterase TrpH
MEGKPVYAVDMHTHTSHYSSCGHQTIEELIWAAHQGNLDAVCVTEHGFRWPDEDLAEVVRRMGLEGQITVLSGEEIAAYDSDGVRQGDYLVFGVPQIGERWEVHELIAHVHAEGGIVIAAHPMRAGYGSDRLVYSLELDALEVYNKNHTPEDIAKAWHCVKATGVLSVGSSDAHRVEHVGMYVSYFAEPVRTIADLVRQIKARKVRVAEMGVRATG